MTKVYNLLSQVGRHHKADKNQSVGVYGAIMHLAPADRSGYEVCPMRSAGCTAACLNTAGFQYASKETARVNRTKLFFENRSAFMEMLVNEIDGTRRRAAKDGMICGIRLNGTSDIPWETVPVLGKKNIMEVFPHVCFMDYTKRHNRKDLPENYRLVFSRSETNEAKCAEALQNGMNVAVVFLHSLPPRWDIGGQSLRVIDGDLHDWRYGDYDDFPNERVIVGLRAKGRGLIDGTGFVIDPYPQDETQMIRPILRRTA